MDRERYAMVYNHFVAVLEMRAAEREEYLDELRVEDPSVADDVFTLLKSDRDAGVADFLGQCVPGYSRLEPISRGGQGTVYRAVQNRTGQRVAVKIVASPNLADANRYQQAVDDFAREIETVATLRHPNIVRIHDAGTCATGPFFVMELIEGGTLAEFQHRLNQHQSARYLESITEAVQEAHTSGVLHLDIKPQNILYDDRLNQPFLVDFGLARLSKAGQNRGEVAGTLSYMAPEQIEGREVDERTDVYGLGATLYYLLTGRPIRRASTLIEARRQLSNHPEEPVFELAEVNSELARICRRCLEVDPQHRYQTTRELSEDLARFREMEDVQHIGSGGNVTLKCSGLIFVINVIVFTLIYAGLPDSLPGEMVTWLTVFSVYGVVFWILYRVPKSIYSSQRRQTMESLWSIWASNILAAIVISIGIRAGPVPAKDATEAILLFYPVLGILTGMALCIMAPRLWRRFYLIAAAIGLLGVVSMLKPVFDLQVAPLIYGAGTSLGTWVWGLQLRNVARELRTPIDRQQQDIKREDPNTPTAIA